MRERVILAFDTSNYTTSVALMRTDGALLANIKYPLPVRQGERGLRQSDAVFAHIKNLPSALSDAAPFLADREIAAVGVSTRPRRVEGSYMPCFLCGVAAAESAAVAAEVPLYRFSHQCGHIMAALYSSGHPEYCARDFIAFHVSGGTTEMLRVHGEGDGFSCDVVGGTRDLHAGQVIDRIGVHMGMPFPAGPHMEAAALANDKPLPRKSIAADGRYFHLSGLENLAERLYNEGEEASLTAAFVLDYIARSLLAVTAQALEDFGQLPLVYAGGVMCNRLIRRRITERYDAAFAEPALSADNAVGIAALTLKKLKTENP